MKINYEALGVASAVVHTASSTLTGFHGNFRGAVNRWLQLHDAKEKPADTAVPLRVWPLYATAPFEQQFDGDGVSLVNGMVFVVSTTEGTLTYDAASTMDLFVNGMSSWDNTGTSVAGDYTTGDEVLTVWAAGQFKKLVRLECSDPDDNGPCYVQIHADTPANDKLVFSQRMGGSGSLDLFFGDGFAPSRLGSALRYGGCTIAISSTQSTYTAWGNDDFRIKATYK